MRTSTQIRRHCVTALSGRHRDGSSQIPVLQGTSTTTSTTPRHALPRKIAQGVFFIDPTSGDRAPSTRTLVDLEITHAVVARGSDLRLSSGMKALFVGSHDPLSRVVAWMRAVRRLGACVIVSDVAAAAGYLVVELSLTPRSAWLRIARGIPPAGDLVLAKLCALALTHSEKDEVSRSDRASDSESAGGHGNCAVRLNHGIDMRTSSTSRRGHNHMINVLEAVASVIYPFWAFDTISTTLAFLCPRPCVALPLHGIRSLASGSRISQSRRDSGLSGPSEHRVNAGGFPAGSALCACVLDSPTAIVGAALRALVTVSSPGIPEGDIVRETNEMEHSQSPPSGCRNQIRTRRRF
ncbi:hypothetical protein EDB83DRAFT_2315653 [Lactarius deliciosus]|nr:hypothetical protein EDB83DRAFT_2315653 [Lactarius deliciosus]